MKFAAQFMFLKREDKLMCLSGRMVSDIPNVERNMTGIEYDIFNPNIQESEQVKLLPDGEYFAYVVGEMIPEQEIEEGTGRPSMTYIFIAEEANIQITKTRR